MAHSSGARLRRFREKLGISLREAARQLHVAHPALKDWEDEEQIPSPPYRDAIEVWTNGHLKADEWSVTERERELMKRLASVRQATTKPAA